MDYKVLITTSGIGSRLGEITKYTNKSLVRVGKKPAISYIIESYPVEIPLVITTGYFSDHVKEFVNLAYPERTIEFIEIDKYEGKGSSLGYSMLKAKEKLQCPFIFHASDTVVTEKVPEPVYNWTGGYKSGDSSQYSSWNLLGDKLISFNDKGAIEYDTIHIGIIGIKEYKKFWQSLEELYLKNPDDTSLNDCRAIERMLEKNSDFKVVNFANWHDVGNITTLNQAREKIYDRFENLEKIDESIFIFDKFVIKFFYNENTVKERVARAKILDGLVPPIEGVTKNFYRYKYIEGNLYSRVINPTNFGQFLRWAKENLWEKSDEVSAEKFKQTCLDFYRDKTKQRINKFLEINSVADTDNEINGEVVPAIDKLLDKVDFNWLCDTEQSQFHGDFIPDNILKTEGGFCLLDWRQNFGGLLKSGDLYYDLAKLNHNLTVNHDIINENLYQVKTYKNSIICDIYRKENMVMCQEALHDFIIKEGYDLKKVKLLTALIWLNMSPLHHHPFNLFLFYFGKLKLWKILKDNN
ncbi:nucleoside-diphosphate-sugar pyrophosphorylase [bacterium (Candidatus Gribaldobacteria) CG_4_10_14_0_2_um_filter_41_16]|uniref:Nucleoside-diphosphate-sugar pyrophosphorylase n=1 Tax=bacterium (Candidatus Gribaldobacteria) CG_4_10_14_0_2_um_filter_41_16 TaxID=2014265 RepID=A0A2M7VI56_9BACT|nr:MAG: nucleoside-diphosphate-sugar pyrophosphorylase [bacterium (Candidatus Gribaldobacteria) CG_4_10_14_0_2_um_filter_41_16]